MSETTIVVGYTPNAQGRAAVRAAIEEAGRRQARLHVLNSGTGHVQHDHKVAGPEDLDELRATLADSGVDHDVEQSLGNLEAADQIMDAVTRLDADLVVLGIRRRTPVGKLLMGSTAQRVLLQAPCPVLAVKE